MIGTQFILEGLLVILLSLACLYGFVLNRRLTQLRRGQTELIEMIEKFDDAARRAEVNLATMQNRGVTLDRDLGKMVTRANFLMDELSVMVNAGGNIAERIEGAVAEVRTMGSNKRKLNPMKERADA